MAALTAADEPLREAPGAQTAAAAAAQDTFPSGAAAAAGRQEGSEDLQGGASHTKLLGGRSCGSILCLSKQMALDLLPLPHPASYSKGGRPAT